MNTAKYSIRVILLLSLVVLLSCRGNLKQTGDADACTPDYSDIDEGECSGMSHFADTLSVEQYHQMILEAIADGDKELFAEMVCYPLSRNYPLPDIEDKQHMIRYFDTLFDEPFRRQIARLDSNSWENVGWRGWLILDGDVWDTDPCIEVNYSSPIEQKHAEYLIKKDMSRLHQSLRGNWRPYDCFFLDSSEYPDFEYSYARVDISMKNDPEKVPEYRLSLFKKGTKASDAPSLILMGNREIEGSMHIVSFVFNSDSCFVCIDPQSLDDGKSYFTMTIHGKKDRKYVIPCKSQMQPFLQHN